jgi:hypothetical protein
MKKIVKLLEQINENLIDIKKLLNVEDVEEVVENIVYNFDVTANWATGNSDYPVTDQISFVNFLQNISSGNTQIVISDFNLVGNRLQCNLSATMFNEIAFYLSYMGVTSVKKLGDLKQFLRLSLNSNNLTNFDFEDDLPNDFKEIELANNQLTIFEKQLPSSLFSLDLENNLLDLSSYIAMENWANNLPNFTEPCYIVFSGNTDSVAGTELETILKSKNVIVRA